VRGCPARSLAPLPLWRPTAFDRRKTRLSDKPAWGYVERHSDGQKDARAEIGRSPLDSLEIAQVLPRPFSKGFLGQATPMASPPHVGGDGAKKFRKNTIGHSPAVVWSDS
jgi:hypothetical protein